MELNHPIIEHAIKELQLIGMYAAEGEEDRRMTANIMEIVQKFVDQNHQGFAAQYCLQMVTKLCTMQPVAPLAGSDDEWKETMHNGLYQNKRCYHVFKDETGAYDANGVIYIRPNGTTFVDANSKVTVTFPYYPNPRYVKVTT